MNNGAHLYQSTNSSTSTLRPRNNRLISFIDDGNDEAVGTSSSAQPSKSTPLFSSRGTSPNNAPTRTRSLNKGSTSSSQTHTRNVSDGASAPQNTDLWTSWSSYATSFLGGDSVSASKGKARAPPQKPPKRMKQDRGYNMAPPAPKWGLSSKDMPSPQPGSLEDRQAMLQAEKRKALLSANAETLDPRGRFKRRDSDVNFPYDEAEQDALVYMHKIRKDDTIAGVMLKYGCQPDVFRKVNRFWPNDNIQTRTHVFLPVDACSVRGKMIDAPQQDDLLEAIPDEFKSNSDSMGARSLGLQTESRIATVEAVSASPLALTASAADEDSLKHDSWVLITNFPGPVEILRMSRKSLGYFPRARRKSNAALTDTSTTSTPKSSFDMLRHPPTHAAQVSMSLNASPVRKPGANLRRESGRQRSSSTTTNQSNFTDALRGPGGVGTLRGLRTEPSRPGPAEDSLNRKFAQYFPDLAIAPPQGIPIARLGLGTGVRDTPRVSTDSVRSHRSNSSSLNEVGGALEGWVRKLAGTKKDKLGPAKMGDLIELETNSELGEPIVEDDYDFPTPTTSAPRKDNENEASALSSATEEALLNERFPMRGRVRNAYGGGKDKGN